MDPIGAEDPPAPETIICPACQAPAAPGQVFCERCGKRIQAPAKNPVRRKPTYGQNIGVEHRRKTIRNARISLMVVGVLLVFGALFANYALNQEIAKVKANPELVLNHAVVNQVKAIIVANFILAGVFIGLFIWAGFNPFAASLTGLVLYVTLLVIAAAMDPLTLIQGWLIKIIIISALIAGIKTSLYNQRRDRGGGGRPILRRRG
jgi:predicted nucleic acid-binding Zn ribbon protein